MLYPLTDAALETPDELGDPTPLLHLAKESCAGDLTALRHTTAQGSKATAIGLVEAFGL